MGRVIRKVPKRWEHPKDENGHYRPLHDETFKEVADEWIKDCLLWMEGKHPDQKDNNTREEYPYYWQWHGDPPDEEYHRPEFKEKADCFQVYENVSEGTPVSPVFESKKEMIKWLITQGYSQKTAESFAEDEYVPSMMLILGKGIISEIHASEFLKKKE